MKMFKRKRDEMKLLLQSVSSLTDLFNSVKLVLENLGADSTAGANRADGDTAFTYLTAFEFVFVLCLMRDILETSEDLGKAFTKEETRHSKCSSASAFHQAASRRYEI